MAQYRKFLVAFFGLLAVYLNRKYGIELSGTEELLADMIVSAGVFLVPNATPAA